MNCVDVEDLSGAVGGETLRYSSFGCAMPGTCSSRKTRLGLIHASITFRGNTRTLGKFLLDGLAPSQLESLRRRLGDVNLLVPVPLCNKLHLVLDAQFELLQAHLFQLFIFA